MPIITDPMDATLLHPPHTLTELNCDKTLFGDIQDAFIAAVGFESRTLRVYDYHVESYVGRATLERAWYVRVEDADTRETAGWLLRIK